MRTKYDCICFRCGKKVEAGKGDFQAYWSLKKSERQLVNKKGRWLVRCFACKGQGNIPINNLTLPSKHIL